MSDNDIRACTVSAHTHVRDDTRAVLGVPLAVFEQLLQLLRQRDLPSSQRELEDGEHVRDGILICESVEVVVSRSSSVYRA